MKRALLACTLAACGGTGAPRAVVTPVHPVHRLAQFPRPAEDELRPPVARHEIAVLEQRDEASPLVTVRVLFDAGSADDPTGREGLTRLTARAMVEGGSATLSYEERVRRLFPMAARIDYHVDRDMTVFVAQVHRDHLAAFRPMLRDLLVHPRFSDEDVARVRTQTLSDLVDGLRGADDEALGRELLQSVVYAGHPYGHPALGTETGLAAITAAEMHAHHAAVFCHGRVHVGLAGGYPAGFATQLRDDLAALPSTCAPPRALPTPERRHGVHVTVVDKPSASATAISLGYPVVLTRSDPDAAAWTLVNAYLGLHRQSSGQLYQALRESRGLNYGDYAYGEHFEQDSGSRFPAPNVQRRQQYASLWLRPVRPDAAHFALRGALRIVARLLEHGVAVEDFDRTRTFLSSYVGLYTQTGSARLGAAMDDAWTQTGPTPWAERLRDAWSHLDRDTMLTVARRHLTVQDLDIVLIAPDARALADAIAHDAPSPIVYDTPRPRAVLEEDREIAVFPLAVRADDVRVVPLSSVFH